MDFKTRDTDRTSIAIKPVEAAPRLAQVCIWQAGSLQNLRDLGQVAFGKFDQHPVNHSN